jgi:hypothetical protein
MRNSRKGTRSRVPQKARRKALPLCRRPEWRRQPIRLIIAVAFFIPSTPAAERRNPLLYSTATHAHPLLPVAGVVIAAKVAARSPCGPQFLRAAILAIMKSRGIVTRPTSRKDSTDDTKDHFDRHAG